MARFLLINWYLCKKSRVKMITPHTASSKLGMNNNICKLLKSFH